MLKNNKSNINKKNNVISKKSEKKSDVLIQIDELMADLDNEYSPLMIKELQSRIIKTISDFKKDLKTVLSDTFEQHSERYRKLSISSKSDNESSSMDPDVPSFISDYENKKNK